MLRHLIIAATTCCAAVSATGQFAVTPAPLDAAAVEESPYRYNGLLWALHSDGFAYTGSASMAAPGVMVTAAHLVYDADTQAWIPIGNVRYYPKYHDQNTAPSQSTEYHSPLGFERWTTYYPERVAADGPGEPLLDTLNVDFAAGYFSPAIEDPGITRHAEVHVDIGGEVGILREDRDKVIVGYPSSTWLMHAHPEINHFCEWQGFDQFPDQQRDLGGYWWGIYTMYNVATAAGGSGGPVYVKDDMGNWLLSGILVAERGSESIFVRAIDETAYEFIEAALFTAGAPAVSRVDNLSVLVARSSQVRLEWTDHSSDESGYTVYRQSYGTWKGIADLPPDTEEYADNSVLPGQLYKYAVQPWSENGNRPPKSNIVTVRTPGSEPVISAFLQQPWLRLYSDGDAGWSVREGTRLRSGKIPSLGQSSLLMDILGPGTVEFEWSASSELNEDYDNPQSPLQGVLFDALQLYLNGNPYTALEGGPVFLSGQAGRQAYSLTLPAGPFRVEWRYRKNEYVRQNEDAGFLYSLSWTPDPSAPYPVYGAFVEDGFWRGSEWLGSYSVELQPWVAHPNLGWLYFIGPSGTGLFGYSVLEEVGLFYTSPEIFPFLYLPERDAWLKYSVGSGTWGSKAWFWSSETGDYIRTP